MALSTGDRLGLYEILAPIGAGGMGEVYRARDTKLKRDVALKVLPDAFARDPERMARFQREAEVLASLNHPNIAAIYGVEDRALVMEMVEGESPKGALPFDDAWHIASQIASALEYAHDRGIIHRDLKPANVKVTPDGVVKLLDFGLAKAFTNQREASPATTENSPTLTIAATEVGMILGTAAYMAPEQAKGKSVDKRADIWAFGVVLYELLTGARPFHGEDVGDILASVIKDRPDLETIPAQVRPLIESCLQKDPRKRLRDIGDAGTLIEIARTSGASQSAPSAPSRSRFRAAGWIAAGVLAVAAAALGFVHFREKAPEMLTGRFDVTLPFDQVGWFSLSPDGRMLAFTSDESGARRIRIRPLDSLESRLIPGTDNAAYPTWSPDGATLAFFSEGKLRKVAVAGGPTQVICDAPTPRGASWKEDGTIAFAPSVNGGLARVPADGGQPAPLTKVPVEAQSDRYPAFLPDGKHFLFTRLNGPPDTSGVYVGSLDGSAPVRLLPDSSRAIYVPLVSGGQAGYLLYVRDSTLVAQPFDPDKMRLTGGAIPLAEEIGNAGNGGFGAFHASKNGVLLYRAGSAYRKRRLVWLDRTGKQLQALGDPQLLANAALSPDGKRLAISIATSGASGDIWLREVARGVVTKFTFLPGLSREPVWSPDGSSIVFRNGAVNGLYDLYRKAADGSSKEELLFRAGINGTPYDISPDGKMLLFSETAATTKDDLWLLPLATGDHKPVQYLASPSSEAMGQFSPDGKWIAYQSNESGQYQTYVQSAPATGAKYQISIAGGSSPRWRRDGRELFYISGDQKMMAVPVKLGAVVFEFGAAQALFAFVPNSNTRDFGYVPSADGNRFLADVEAESGVTVRPLIVVMNWQAGLKK